MLTGIITTSILVAIALTGCVSEIDKAIEKKVQRTKERKRQ